MRQGWRAALWRLKALLLAAAAGGGATQAPEVAHAAVSPAEQAAWDRARGSGNAAAFQRYLELYPTGQYAEDAFRILVEKSWRAPSRASAPGTAAAPDPQEASAGQAVAAAQSLY